MARQRCQSLWTPLEVDGNVFEQTHAASHHLRHRSDPPSVSQLCLINSHQIVFNGFLVRSVYAGRASCLTGGVGVRVGLVAGEPLRLHSKDRCCCTSESQRSEPTCPGNGQRVLDNINTFVGSFLLYVQADKYPCISPV